MNGSAGQDVKYAVLSRISDSKNTTVLPDINKEVAGKIDHPVLEKEELLRRFIEELDALGVESYREPDTESVRKCLHSIINNKVILSWKPEMLPYDIGELLADEQVICGNESREVRARAEIGLTGCDAAVAETGSLILVSGKGKPKTASLLPYTHVALVEKSVIVYSLNEYFTEITGDLKQHTHCNIITGPSRTADIELTLSLGVHGPGKMIVIIGP